ncbi:MAG: phospholipase D-like domain-containing protein [Burkholderiales bacterium]
MTISAPVSLPPLIHVITVTAGLLIYVLATRIGKQQRRPSVALAWVLTIAAFPYAGIPLFLFFGTRKFPRPLHRLVAPAAEPAHPSAPTWSTHLLEAMNIEPLTGNAAVRLHKNGDESWRQLLDLIDSASHELDICTFLLGDDAIGDKIVDKLIGCANNGVRIRLLLDSVGSMGTSRKRIRQMEYAGVLVRRFMPILHNPIRGRTNLRIHRKLALADRQKLWSGGRNLADEYFIDRPGKPAWIDLSFVIEGPLAVQAHAQFERDWLFACGRYESADATEFKGESASGSIPAQWVPSGPDHADDTIYNLLLAAACHAHSRIIAVTPYFVPNDTLLEAWCLACRRGVAITLIVPEKSNHLLADLARGRALLAMAEAGARVLLCPDMVHAKMIAIDDTLALCGSVNLDGRSLFLNYEAMAVFYGRDEIEWFGAWHAELAQRSSVFIARQPSWMRDTIEGIVRVIGFEL